MRNNFWTNGRNQRVQSEPPAQPEPVVAQPAPTASLPVTQPTALPLISPLRAIVLRDFGSSEEPPFPGLVDFPESVVGEKKLEQGQIPSRRKNKWLWWPKKYKNLYKSVRF